MTSMADMMPSSTTVLTRRAHLAAQRALEAAYRAQRAAEAASDFAAHTQDITAQAVEAQHQTLCSPVKGVRLGPTVLPIPDPPPPFVDTKRFQDALRQLELGHAVVEFPPHAVDPPALPAMVAALQASSTLTHLTLRRAIPSPSMADDILEALHGNQRLTYLNLAQNRLGEMAAEESNLEALKKLKVLLDQCETLTHVDVSGNGFGAAGTELVCQGVRESVSLRKLDLSGNSILVGPDGDDEVVENATNAMREMLTRNKFLTSLIARDNHLTAESLETISEALKTTTRLTSLDLAGNNLGSPGAAIIANVLTDHHGYRTVDISQNKIGWKGIVSLGDCLAHRNRTVTRLVLQKNKFGVSKEPLVTTEPQPEGAEEVGEDDSEEAEERRKEEAAKAEKENKAAEKAVMKLAEILRENPVLTDFDVAFNGIGPGHVACLLEGLQQNRTLKFLNLEMTHLAGTHLGDFNATALQSLGKIVQSHPTLASLNVKWNFLQTQGADILGRSLSHNKHLTALDVGRNFLSDTGLGHLIRGLHGHPTIAALGVVCNGITSSGMAVLAQWVARTPSLRQLDVSENEFGAEGFVALSHGVQKSGLRKLIAARCEIGCCDDALHSLLQDGPLVWLDMSDNPISHSTLRVAVDVLKSNSRMEIFRLWSRQPDIDGEARAALAADLLQSNAHLQALDLGFADVPEDAMAVVTELLWRSGPPPPLTTQS